MLALDGAGRRQKSGGLTAQDNSAAASAALCAWLIPVGNVQAALRHNDLSDAFQGPVERSHGLRATAAAATLPA